MSALPKYVEPEPDEDDRAHGATMPFLEHLDELRTRLIVSIAALAVGFVVSLIFADRIFAFAMQPLRDALPKGHALIYTEATEPIFVFLTIAGLGGAILASPVIFWQLWLFIAPGLYSREKKLGIPFVVSATVCFLAGAAFSHYLAFPSATRFFASFGSEYVEFRPRISPALSLYVRMMLAAGLAFQMPTVTLFLARMHLVTARWMARQTKYAILVIFVAAAVVTPDGNPVGQVTMAVPMIGLYGISIAIAWIVGPRGTRRKNDDPPAGSPLKRS